MSTERHAPAPLSIGERVRVTDRGVVRKINIGTDGTQLAALVECDGSGSTTWLSLGLLEKLSTEVE